MNNLSELNVDEWLLSRAAMSPYAGAHEPQDRNEALR